MSPSGFSVGAVLPYAMPILRMLRNRRFGNKSKIALGVVAVLGGVGLYYQRKNKRDAAY
jgi:hypothetical protein